MFGIILWIILILFIVTCACPGFWTSFLISAVSVWTAYFALKWLFSKLAEYLSKH